MGRQGVFAELAGRHEGQAAVVVGGGPTAMQYRDQWPDDALIIGIKEHALIAGWEQDYLVAVDNAYHNELKPLLESLERNPKSLERKPKLISQYGWADYQLGTYYAASNSGIVGAWCAHVMGCYPVILTGMDLFSGSQDYFHDQAKSSNGRKHPTKYWLMKWRELTMQDTAKGIALRVLGDGPLCELFPQYNPRETVTRCEPLTPVMDIRGVHVEFGHNIAVRGIPYRIGERAYLHASDANMVISMGKAKEIGPD